MTRIFYSLFAAIALILLTGCVTIYDGRMQKIKIETEPTEAMVTVEEAKTKAIVAFDTSPMEIELERKHSYHLKISKEGYQPTVVGIWRQANDAIWIDLGLLPFHWPGTALGLISALCDHLTGAIWDLAPADVKVKLEPIPNKAENSTEKNKGNSK